MKNLMKKLLHRNLKVISQSNYKVDNSSIEDSSMTYASCKILLKHLIVFSNLKLARIYFSHLSRIHGINVYIERLTFGHPHVWVTNEYSLVHDETLAL